jgi:phosphatidylserine/phosphatidylglycerophosphate/cardiolipin synthase-like enzyme
VQLKAIPARGPEVNELSAADVSEVVRLAAAARKGEREVLRILTVERRARQVLPAVALVYRALQGDELQVGFAIDGRISQEHEIAFARGGGLQRQPIFQGLLEKVRLAPLPGRVAELVQAAEAQRKESGTTGSRSAVDKAALAVVAARSEAERAEAEAAEKRAREALKEAESRLQRGPVRPVPVYEHPEILEQAMETAQSRLLIVSPWIRRAVVNQSFLQSVRRACKRGVTVSIGFGLGADPGERPQDVEARQKLETLSEELDLLQVRRLGDTHAKVLVKDSDFFVITSFNWLSFRGVPSKPFREEWGTMVRDPALVDEFYAEIIERFGERPK